MMQAEMQKNAQQCSKISVQEYGNVILFEMKCGDPKQGAIEMTLTYTLHSPQHASSVAKTTMTIMGQKLTSNHDRGRQVDRGIMQEVASRGTGGMNYKSALIVGAGSGLSASLARVFTKAGMKVALAARSAAKLAEFVQATGAKALTATPPSATKWKSCLPISMPPVTPDVVVYNASYRTRGPFTDLDPPKSRKRSRSQLRRLPGGAGGGQAHAAAQAGRDAVHRRIGEREGLCAVGAFRHGQVCACAGWRKAWRANCRRRASTSRISSSTAASRARAGRAGRTSRTHCSIPTRSRRAI